MVQTTEGPPRRGGVRALWPWIMLALALLVAVWHVVDFPEDVDPEFPAVVRPTFSRRPPPAYRLAEPGDTIDHVALDLAAAGIVLAAWGLIGRRRAPGGPGLWRSALGLSIAAAWYAATPGPTFDGWYGWGWRTILDPAAPASIRAALVVAALMLATVVLVPLWLDRHRWRELWTDAGRTQVRGLLVAALVLVLLRQGEIPGVEPVGYWPRWSFLLGVLAWDLALLRVLPRLRSWARELALATVGVVAWLGLVSAGLDVTWYHRPLARLRTVEPGKIYISAMPTYRGLAVAYRRHPFRTIINLFPEDTPLRSPLLDDELRFAREHGIRYIGSPNEARSADRFLDRTLAVARDPSAWPILVHCHGCQDRTPAWMGIYRFVYQGRSLAEILTEYERHRGYRPKASVTLLYNRVLAPRAPERYAHDPTAPLLRRCAEGTRDPYYDQLEYELRMQAKEDRERARRREASRPTTGQIHK